MDQRKYLEALSTLAKHKVSAEIPNDAGIQSVCLLNMMMHYAERTIRIFTPDLDERIYGSQLSMPEIKRFVGRSGFEIRILIKNKHSVDPNTHVLIETLRKLMADSSDEYQLRGSVRIAYLVDDKKGEIGNMEHYFAVMDEQGYRLEFSREDAECSRAIANFNDQQKSRSLASLFDIAFFKSIKAQGCNILDTTANQSELV